MQSHFVDSEDEGTREVWLLPALPEKWSEGHVKGLVARGGFVVDLEWSGGRVRKVKVQSRFGGKVRFRFDVAGNGGGRVKGDGFDGDEQEEGGIVLSTEEGGKYEFEVGWE